MSACVSVTAPVRPATLVTAPVADSRPVPSTASPLPTITPPSVVVPAGAIAIVPEVVMVPPVSPAPATIEATVPAAVSVPCTSMLSPLPTITPPSVLAVAGVIVSASSARAFQSSAYSVSPLITRRTDIPNYPTVLVPKMKAPNTPGPAGAGVSARSAPMFTQAMVPAGIVRAMAA